MIFCWKIRYLNKFTFMRFVKVVAREIAERYSVKSEGQIADPDKRLRLLPEKPLENTLQ